MERRLLLLCKERNGRIMSILAEQDPSEVVEFQTTIQMVQVVVNRLLNGKKQIVIDVPLLDRVYVILGDYEEILQNFVSSGRLRRLLGSNRLRRRLEKINSSLHVELKHFVDTLKQLNSNNSPRDIDGPIIASSASNSSEESSSSSSSSNSNNKEKKKKKHLKATTKKSGPKKEKKTSSSKSSGKKKNNGKKHNNNEEEPSDDVSFSPIVLTTTAGKKEELNNEKQQQQQQQHNSTTNENKDNDEYEKILGSATTTTTTTTTSGLSKPSSSSMYAALPKTAKNRTPSSIPSGGSGSDEDLSDVSMNIKDLEGKAMWSELFGAETFQVEWKRFVTNLNSVLKGQISADDEALLKHIIDNSGTGYVNVCKWSDFLKGFGPLPRIITNVRNVLTAPWFHGFLSSKEAELLLEDQPIGTFLIRFSRSTAGAFALAFVQQPKHILHILVESAMPEGLKIQEEDSEGVLVFQSLKEIVKHYAMYLTIPFSSELPRESWFHGDVSPQEAQEMLADQPIGTFLIRFSSRPGCFAASYVADGQEIKHALIQALDSVPNQVTYQFAGETEVFEELSELVNAYNSTLKHALPSMENEVAPVLRKLSAAINKGGGGGEGGGWVN